MHGLEKGANQLAAEETNQKARKIAIDSLNGLIDDLNAGIGIWKDKLNKDIKVSNDGYGGWAGFTVETRLFELELDARDKARQASNGQSSLDEPLVELAYGKLAEGQTPGDRANAAVNAMEDKIKRVKSLISTIQNTKPKKPAGKKAVKTKAKAAPAKKKAAKKKVAKKKTATKKAAKKKAAKKKAATKKKAAKKKAVKKKATKKAPTRKKAAKKKATKKKASAKKKSTKKKAVKKKKAKRRR
ncbi:MAG: hypothetical protein PVG89_03075 [Gammaproteobacteria bacterium]|jgi:hypothetical protein